MRLAWTTDPHLNHVPMGTWEEWISEIVALDVDGLLLSGDISEGDDVEFELRRLAETLGQPIFFVLGNHDFYQRSIAKTRQNVIALCREHPLLHYLTDAPPLEIAPHVYLVGDDGWGDATVGDYESSPVRLNDFRWIDDFRPTHREEWIKILNREGRMSAERLESKLRSLPQDASAVLVLTHVPPYRETCWYEGRTTNDDWAPFFVCGAIGEMLDRVTYDAPHVRFITLCGHTHHAGIAQMSPRHQVLTGAAMYGSPRVEGVVVAQPSSLEVSLRASFPSDASTPET